MAGPLYPPPFFFRPGRTFFSFFLFFPFSPSCFPAMEMDKNFFFFFETTRRLDAFSPEGATRSPLPPNIGAFPVVRNEKFLKMFELFFSCDQTPLFPLPGLKGSSPPPLFLFCRQDACKSKDSPEKADLLPPNRKRA